MSPANAPEVNLGLFDLVAFMIRWRKSLALGTFFGAFTAAVFSFLFVRPANETVEFRLPAKFESAGAPHADGSEAQQLFSEQAISASGAQSYATAFVDSLLADAKAEAPGAIDALDEASDWVDLPSGKNDRDQLIKALSPLFQRLYALVRQPNDFVTLRFEGPDWVVRLRVERARSMLSLVKASVAGANTTVAQYNNDVKNSLGITDGSNPTETTKRREKAHLEFEAALSKHKVVFHSIEQQVAEREKKAGIAPEPVSYSPLQDRMLQIFFSSGNELYTREFIEEISTENLIKRVVRIFNDDQGKAFVAQLVKSTIDLRDAGRSMLPNALLVDQMKRGASIGILKLVPGIAAETNTIKAQLPAEDRLPFRPLRLLLAAFAGAVGGGVLTLVLTVFVVFRRDFRQRLDASQGRIEQAIAGRT